MRLSALLWQRALRMLLLALLCALLLWLAMTLFEAVPVTKNTGYSQAARQNPWLAASMFLADRQRVLVRDRFALLEHLSPEHSAEYPQPKVADTIILVNARGAIDAQRLQYLWPWLERGGTLITALDTPFFGLLHQDDALLHALGVSLGDAIPAGYVPPMRHASPAQGTDGRHLCPDATPTSVYPLPNGYSAKVQPLSPHTLQLDSSLLVPRWQGTFVRPQRQWATAAAFAVGAGEVILMQSTQIWRNRWIQCDDHAYLLWSLVKPTGQIWLLENRDPPSLWTMLWRYLPYGVLTFAVLLLSVLWRALVRFGPVFSSPPPQRRSFAEHIRASALLLWRHRQYTRLVLDLRVLILQRMARCDPNFQLKTQAEKSHRLACLAGLEADQVHLAIFSEDIRHADQWLRCMRTLKILKDCV